MIDRLAGSKIMELSQSFKAVAVIGPRQSGKTTLVKACFPEKPYVSLENPDQRNFAIEDPRNFLKKYSDGAVLDEVQRAPEILSYLQQILDEDKRKGLFILTGSNNFLLQEKITQSLAGRAAYLDLLPFSVKELEEIPGSLYDINTVLFKGAYPPVQTGEVLPQNWFVSYVRTYIERDVRQLKNIENLLIFEKLLSLCAGRVGQQINYSNLSIETGLDVKTVQSWIGILQASFIIHLLPPYFQNFNKRIIKAPKLYFYDTGLACHLLRIKGPETLFQHPMRGAIFENFVITELLKNRFNAGRSSNLYYWKDHSGNEIDILIDEGIELRPIEVKSGATVSSDYFKNLRFWQKLTGKEGGSVIYAGDEHQNRAGDIQVIPWRDVPGL